MNLDVAFQMPSATSKNSCNFASDKFWETFMKNVPRRITLSMADVHRFFRNAALQRLFLASVQL